MPKSLYDAINEAWRAAGGDITRPPHLQPLEDRARQLDAQLGELIKPHIDSYQDGLISAAELVGKIIISAGTQPKPES